MSYTSTMRIQLGKHLLNGESGAESKGPESDSRGLQLMDLKMTSRETPPSLRVVKTCERYLTLTFELCPQTGGELCIRRVKSPVPILTHVPTANRKLVKGGPLPALLESIHPQSSPHIQEVVRVKTLPGKVWEHREGKRPATTTLESPRKNSHSWAVSFNSDATYNSSPAQEPVSPKRKPHRSGDTLRILDGVSHVEVKKGEQAELHCTIQGKPPLAASWVRNKKPVVDGPRISVRTSDTESCLLIQQVCEEDSGGYTLCVHNQNGSIQHHTTLAVVDHPSPPSGKPLISALQSASLTLSWSGPCYDGGSAVLSYRIEVKQAEQDSWTLLTDTCVNTSYHVSKGLLAGERYQFRVRACNAYGVSEAGEESDVVTMSSNGDGESEYEEPIEYAKVSINTTDSVDDLYVKLEKLGMGKFGQVYKLQEKASGKIFAGKFSRVRKQKDVENARAEVELMNKLHHPRLVHCVAAFQERGWVVLILEYIAGGELFERIVADGFEHTEITSIQYISQILSGLGYMHQQGIVHLDLKPENIVCINKISTKVKLIDFGLARKLEPGVPLKVLQGTAEFVAPEVIAFEPVGFTTDMWSLGVICYILLSGDSPFQGENDVETLQNITSACWDFDDETNAVLSDSAKDFIRRLLQKNMKSRLTADQALDHPWIQDKGISSKKTLSKERMKKFLARQKWQKTGKAVLALKRMAMLSNKSDTNSPSPATEDETESKEVFTFLQEQLQRPPAFTSPLKDQSEVAGSSARFHCHIEGFPDPEVLWFFSGSPIQESKRFQIEYEDSGSCTLVIANVSLEDVGVYTCKALNAHGQKECSAKLNVHSLHAERRKREGNWNIA
ncbi:myosin light chain kinase, smooth muscle-like isoform X2 [Pseudophryne corroboree]|uniref:myosin light chain kinase, smooth muscle-like isoform X2 n=1 Tax=Pseudophryne corroboree TaxID=495146 RepID=UPI00308129DC